MYRCHGQAGARFAKVPICANNLQQQGKADKFPVLMHFGAILLENRTQIKKEKQIKLILNYEKILNNEE